MDDTLESRLFTAVRNNNMAAAEYLLARGANANAQNDADQTPLHRAMSEEMTRLLIDNGADISARDKNGCTPLYWAVAGGAETQVTLLISSGADVNAKNGLGISPLQLAAFLRYDKVAATLIANGADTSGKSLDRTKLLNDIETMLGKNQTKRLKAEVNKKGRAILGPATATEAERDSRDARGR